MEALSPYGLSGSRSNFVWTSLNSFKSLSFALFIYSLSCCFVNVLKAIKEIVITTALCSACSSTPQHHHNWNAHGFLLPMSKHPMKWREEEEEEAKRITCKTHSGNTIIVTSFKGLMSAELSLWYQGIVNHRVNVPYREHKQHGTVKKHGEWERELMVQLHWRNWSSCGLVLTLILVSLGHH